MGTVAQSFLKFWPYITDFIGVRYHIILSVKLLHKPIDELLKKKNTDFPEVGTRNAEENP